jgi:hypothetical protein
MTRLRVLYLPPPLHMRQPWEGDVNAAVCKRHNLSMYNPELPLEATSKRRAAFAAENIDRIARGETPLALIDQRDNVSHFSDHSETLRRLNVQLSGCNG